VKVTVIAAGFDSGQLPYKKVDIRREPAASTRGAQPASVSVPSSSAESTSTSSMSPAGYSPAVVNGTPRSTSLDIDDELDVPDFLK
jgi:cell division protein FtsZ